MNISSLSEQFAREGVIVTLEWTHESSLVSFNISVHPHVPVQLSIIQNISSSLQLTAMAQLLIPYNTVYNISISATVLCGLSNTTYILLNYGECHNV